MINRRPRAWSQSRGPTGAFTSVQRASLPSPAVEHSPAGARRLGDFIRPARRAASDSDTPDSVTCWYAILGGLLARTPGGWIAFTQTVGSPLEVRSEIDGFFPRLATRRVRRGWSGVLYPHLQTRLHVALGRRYFARLRTEAAR